MDLEVVHSVDDVDLDSEAVDDDLGNNDREDVFDENIVVVGMGLCIRLVEDSFEVVLLVVGILVVHSLVEVVVVQMVDL